MTPRSTPALAATGSVSRSIQLFRAFRVEQSDPDFFYSLLARDSIREVQRWCPLTGASVLDVGGGPGYFADAFTTVLGDTVWLPCPADRMPRRSLARLLCLPFADGAFDVTYSSNVLEHVPDPEGMVAEMVRVTRPGGTVVVSWTPWLSPWGGHETSPWHYLGGVRAADRYAVRHGRRPKNDFGRSLFACSAGRMLRWVRRAEEEGHLDLVDMLPRYHPAWARWVVHVPGLREVVSWNVMLVVRPR